MRMQCEHFVYGLFPEGYQTYKSRGVTDILTEQSYHNLLALRLPQGQKEATVQMMLPTEDVITISHLQRKVDNYGREGIWNHTIIMRISDYLNVYPPINLVKDQLLVTKVTNPLLPLIIT